MWASVILEGMPTQEKDHGQGSEVSSEIIEFWVMEYFTSRNILCRGKDCVDGRWKYGRWTV